MEIGAFLLLLTGSFFYSLYAVSVKISGNKLVLFAGMNVIFVAIGLAFIPFVPLPSLNVLPYLCLSSLCYNLTAVAMSYGVKNGDFSVAIPIMHGAKVVMVTFLSFFALDEHIHFLEFVSIVIILFAFLIQVDLKIFLTKLHMKTVLLMCLAAFGSAAQLISDTRGVRLLDNPFTYIVWIHLAGLPVVIYTCIQCRSQLLRLFHDHAQIICIGAVCDTISYVCVLIVVYKLQVLNILPVTYSSIIFTTLIGIYILKEKQGVRRIAASVIIFLSIIFTKMS